MGLTVVLGGSEHDWAYILGRLNLLDLDQALGRAIHTIGVVIFFGSIIWGIALTIGQRTQNNTTRVM